MAFPGLCALSAMRLVLLLGHWPLWWKSSCVFIPVTPCFTPNCSPPPSPRPKRSAGPGAPVARPSGAAVHRLGRRSAQVRGGHAGRLTCASHHPPPSPHHCHARLHHATPRLPRFLSLSSLRGVVTRINGNSGKKQPAAPLQRYQAQRGSGARGRWGGDRGRGLWNEMWQGDGPRARLATQGTTDMYNKATAAE